MPKKGYKQIKNIMNKNWILSIEDGFIGGRTKSFYLFSSCIKYAIEHINEDSWVYIDNYKIPELKRLYIKVPDEDFNKKDNYLKEKIIIKNI